MQYINVKNILIACSVILVSFVLIPMLMLLTENIKMAKMAYEKRLEQISKKTTEEKREPKLLPIIPLSTFIPFDKNYDCENDIKDVTECKNKYDKELEYKDIEECLAYLTKNIKNLEFLIFERPTIEKLLIANFEEAFKQNIDYKNFHAILFPYYDKDHWRIVIYDENNNHISEVFKSEAKDGISARFVQKIHGFVYSRIKYLGIPVESALDYKHFKCKNTKITALCVLYIIESSLFKNTLSWELNESLLNNYNIFWRYRFMKSQKID